MRRVPFYELAGSKGSIRLFNRKVYMIRGFFAVENETGKLKRLSDIYYQIRTVKNQQGLVIAKRKSQGKELLTTATYFSSRLA